jgi:hypothetical protein
VPFVWRGIWDSELTYSIGDLVSFTDPDDGVEKVYGATIAVDIGIDPTDTVHWSLVPLAPPSGGSGGESGGASHKILEYDTGFIPARWFF